MDMRELGRLGGRATVAKYGKAHMSAIGKRGFAAISTFAKGGRKAALAKLARRGKITPRHATPDVAAAEFEQLYQQIDTGDF